MQQQHVCNISKTNVENAPLRAEDTILSVYGGEDARNSINSGACGSTKQDLHIDIWCGNS